MSSGVVEAFVVVSGCGGAVGGGGRACVLHGARVTPRACFLVTFGMRMPGFGSAGYFT